MNKQIHYAMQVCDTAYNQTNNRYCNTDRTTLSIKSITSFMLAVQYMQTVELNVKHNILFVDDNSSVNVKKYLQHIKHVCCNNTISIDIYETKVKGLMSTIKTCYDWLHTNGSDLVCQIQDDYLFSKSSIFEMVDIFFQMKTECNTDAIISPFNDPYLWSVQYRNTATPRAVIVGKHRYWISYYDMSCTFMTSINIFSNHKDLLDNFCNLPSKGINGQLESITLNKMLIHRGVLGLIPMNSLALHIQSDNEKDPYVDWKSWWDNIKILEM